MIKKLKNKLKKLDEMYNELDAALDLYNEIRYGKIDCKPQFLLSVYLFIFAGYKEIHELEKEIRNEAK